MDTSVLRGSASAVTGGPAISSQLLGWCPPDAIQMVISSYLTRGDLAHLTGTCSALRAEPLRRVAITISIKRRLPQRIAPIYAAVRALGPIDIVSTINSARRYIYPQINQMRSSVAFFKSRSGHKGIIMLVRGSAESSIYEPLSQNTKKIYSVIILQERNVGDPDSWQLIGEHEKAITALEPTLPRDIINLNSQIIDTITSIISGSHLSISLCPPDLYYSDYHILASKFQYTVPEGYSLMIQDTTGEVFSQISRSTLQEGWTCNEGVSKASRYKIYLRAPNGNLIPEKGPDRYSTFDKSPPIWDMTTPEFTLPTS